MAQPINVCLIGHKFMGRTHTNAYLKVNKFFTDLPVLPVMHTIVGRNAGGAEGVRPAVGLAEHQHRLEVRRQQPGGRRWWTSARRTTPHAEMSIGGSGGGEARRVREAAGRHARRCPADAGRRPQGQEARRSSGTTTAACRRSRWRTSLREEGRSAASTTSARSTCRTGPGRTCRYLAVQQGGRPAPARTATWARTSSTWPASSPATSSTRSSARSRDVRQGARRPAAGLRRRHRRRGAAGGRRRRARSTSTTPRSSSPA